MTFLLFSQNSENLSDLYKLSKCLSQSTFISLLSVSSLCIGTAGGSSKFSPGERWRIALMHCHPHRHVPLLSEALCHSHPPRSGPAQAAIFHTHFHLLHSPYLLPHFLQPRQSRFTLPPLSHTARPLSAWKDRTYCVSVQRTYQTKMTLPASAGCIRETTCYHCNPFPK